MRKYRRDGTIERADATARDALRQAHNSNRERMQPAILIMAGGRKKPLDKTWLTGYNKHQGWAMDDRYWRHRLNLAAAWVSTS